MFCSNLAGRQRTPLPRRENIDSLFGLDGHARCQSPLDRAPADKNAEAVLNVDGQE
jgi:hypothetical protein